MRAREPAQTTIGDLLAEAGWVILNCENPACGRRVATQLPAFIEKFGPDASSDLVRDTARCAECGHKGVTTTTPSWAGADKRWSVFPGEGYVFPRATTWPGARI